MALHRLQAEYIDQVKNISDLKKAITGLYICEAINQDVDQRLALEEFVASVQNIKPENIPDHIHHGDLPGYIMRQNENIRKIVKCANQAIKLYNGYRNTTNLNIISQLNRYESDICDVLPPAA